MQRYSRLMWAAALACWLILALAVPAWAQSDNTLRLSLRKQFGFSMGGQIQGTFKLSVSGADSLASVTFRLASAGGNIEPVVLGEITQPPFEITFSTDKYPHGQYQLSAAAATAGGQVLESNVLRVEFVSAEAGMQAAGKIILPILVLVGIIVILSTVGPLLIGGGGKKRPATAGEPRDYGVLGGSVCPKCGRPFARHWWAFNVSFAGKFDRCPYCSKWSFVRRASPQELAAAESAEAAQDASSPVLNLSPEEKLQRQIEDSKYL